MQMTKQCEVLANVQHRCLQTFGQQTGYKHSSDEILRLPLAAAGLSASPTLITNEPHKDFNKKKTGNPLKVLKRKSDVQLCYGDTRCLKLCSILPTDFITFKFLRPVQ